MRRYDWEQMNVREVGFKNYFENDRDRSKYLKFSDGNAELVEFHIDISRGFLRGPGTELARGTEKFLFLMYLILL